MQFFTLQAIGSVCIRHYDFMLGEPLKSVYLNVSLDMKSSTGYFLNLKFLLKRLIDPSVPLRLKGQVLNNIETYLQVQGFNHCYYRAELIRLCFAGRRNSNDQRRPAVVENIEKGEPQRDG